MVCGSGLAAQQVCAALAPYLCDALSVTWITGMSGADSDIVYGNLAPPTAYDFNLSLGVSEPDLILNSDTTFSYGTHVTNWGARRLNWVQAFHQPLPVLEGATFQHYLTQQGQSALEPFLVSAMAARRGVFAHPPEDLAHPLSRAEYGYHFDAAAYGALFELAAARGGVRKVAADISAIDAVDGVINAVHLSNGQTLTAGLWIDATGPQAMLLSQIAGVRQGTRRLCFHLTRMETETPGPAVTTINGTPYGWQAKTALRTSTLMLTTSDPDSDLEAQAALETAPLRSATVDICWRDMAWVGNCVGIGHAACVAEPLTIAPMRLLQRDIERLLPLLPVSDDLSVERREYNRQALADYVHADLFTRALFETQPMDGAPYWRAATRTPADERLVRKIEQFESRGLHVAFDLEPFGPEDWLTLHYGMGRSPLRYDRTVDGADSARIRQYLETLRGNIENAVRSMPPHASYLNGLTNYLRQTKG
ncbi:tryptophan halogenase family protein [Asticcacaulis biprosthecium C19]|uniref:Tryptophan halogenase family protein n=1 Tax=Asticcacaulis biprosthecium C19 TaxID=715226 RepID=F4QTE3_9CAUL|nr:tryptophan halogenase family protein [Asticcacaulis biprosthecium C19]